MLTSQPTFKSHPQIPLFRLTCSCSFATILFLSSLHFFCSLLLLVDFALHPVLFCLLLFSVVSGCVFWFYLSLTHIAICSLQWLFLILFLNKKKSLFWIITISLFAHCFSRCHVILLLLKRADGDWPICLCSAVFIPVGPQQPLWFAHADAAARATEQSTELLKYLIQWNICSRSIISP